ncbi:MAG TPA: hypothetical protein VJK02_00245 [Anaerolineales bacterium]|nr:hypothetical protein [Anaerolineales bacterium]
MSDGRQTTDGRRRIRTIAVLVTAAASVVVLGAVVIRSWMSSNQRIEGEGYEGVVFNRVHAASILGPMLSADPDGFWTPMDADIQTFERGLTAAAQTNHPEGLRSLDEYRRQYFGYSRDGKRQILVVGLCDASSVDWTEEFVSVGEGGCHFEATYDVMQGTVSSLWALAAPRQAAPAGTATSGR